VKELDQDARSALRKHGVRFGQFTVFLPALLKPAPTRLRLVLWSLWNGLSDFPEAPPPGLVTIPNLAEVPRGHYTLSGYHPAGARAIRIDMLERLADIVRTKDSRVGFEATPEMLSITGMTLDQFAGLMEGLGYQGEKAERAKAKPAEVVPAPVAEAEVSLNPVPEEVSLIVPEPAPAEAAAEADPAAEAVPETEVFYTFTWAPKPRPRPQRPDRPARPQGEGPRRDGRRDRNDRPKAEAPVVSAEGQPAPTETAPAERPPRPDRGPRPEGGKRDKERSGERSGDRAERGGKPNRRDDRKDAGKDGNKPRSFEARPPRAEKPIDPDSPFAVLAALKSKI
jgi:ATP-dependent RNA helicase SUPV3L1/SUV3